MSFVPWRSEFATGLEAYDAQHMALFAQVNVIYGHLESFRTDLEPFLEADLLTFTDLVRAHARTEEDLMARIGYPGLAAHGAAHRAFRDHLEGLLARRIFGGEAHTEILAAISEFREHFEAEDEQAFIALLRGQGPPDLP